MTAHVFEDKGNYDLEDKIILPFIPFKQTAEMKTPTHGGYSEVYPVRLHPAHHNFWPPGPEDEEPLIAVKKLISPDKAEFDKEVSMLTTLGSKSVPHPHLIKLLATYKQKQKYHLLFPYANANLMKYWQAREPFFDAQTVLWCMKQMTGIASAVLVIHKFRVTIPLVVSGGVGGGEQRALKDVNLSVWKGEELYGRHGDIKPENVLWFEKAPDCSDPHGILQLADFGLGRFHGRDSRSNVPPDTVWSSPTYEPPETKLHRPVSRANDMWSLGCLYLEFVTWLLMGKESVEEFGDFRARPVTNQQNIPFTDDNFFTVIRGSDDAVVRETVVAWVDKLHCHEKCSQLIHDLLDIVMDNLLLIDSKDRWEAPWLYMKSKSCLETAYVDLDYLLKPVPPMKKRTNAGHSQSESNVIDQQGRFH